MSWFKRNLGLDGFDLTTHVAVTIMLMVIASMSRGPEEAYPLIAGASLIVLGVRRKIALRSAERTGLTTGEMTAERIADLEQRVAELEAAQAQVAELEERLDFAERLLPAGPGGAAPRLPPAGEG